MTLIKVLKIIGPVPAAFLLGYVVWKKLNA